MFPTTPDPLRARFLRAADRVIEFATLGEYGLPEAPAEGDSRPVDLAPVLPREPAIVRTGSVRAERVRPATAAARLREQAPAKPRPTSTRVALRSMALSGAAPRAPQARTREGAVPPAPQPCVTADAQR